MPTRLILIRHGETDWSYNKRYCSFSDLPLNERGRIQARRLSIRLAKEKIHKIYSSDMKRSLEFAEIVFKGRRIEKVAILREMDFGKFEGLTYEEVMKSFPKSYKRWLEDPLSVIIPEGEGLEDFAKRVRKVVKKILSENKNKTATIVTHAGPIRVILCDILKIDLREIFIIRQDVARLNIIEFVKGKGRVLLLNG